MKKEDFAEVFGDIDEKYIVEARADYKDKKTVWLKWVSMVACLCLVLTGIWHMNTSDFADIDGENYGESYKESVTAKPDEISEQDAESLDAPGTVADAPVQSETDLNGNADEFNNLWGGSYLDENGYHVIWLTENTTENQKKVFERNPDLLEERTIFKTADFSLVYLTELLETISKGMQDGKLSYVTSAAVMEQTNRVSVTMTTDDVNAVASVSSFDTLGGAIEFHYGESSGRESMNVVE